MSDSEDNEVPVKSSSSLKNPKLINDDDEDDDYELSSNNNKLEQDDDDFESEAKKLSLNLPPKILSVKDSEELNKEKESNSKNYLSVSNNTLFFHCPNYFQINVLPEKSKSQIDLKTRILKWKEAEDMEGIFLNSLETSKGPILLDTIDFQKLASNGRILEWDDGTSHLVLGSHIFEISTVDSDNCYVFETQTCTEKDLKNNSTRDCKVLSQTTNINKRIVLNRFAFPDQDKYSNTTVKVFSSQKKKVIMKSGIIKQDDEVLEKYINANFQKNKNKSSSSASNRRYNSLTVDTLEYDSGDDYDDYDDDEDLGFKSKRLKRAVDSYDEDEDDDE